MLRRCGATPGPGCALPVGPAPSSFLQEITTETNLGEPLGGSTFLGVGPTLFHSSLSAL